MVNEAILKLALKRAELPEVIGRVLLAGVPGVNSVWVVRDADTVEVQAVNGKRLLHPIKLDLQPPPQARTVTVRADDLNSIKGRDGTQWRPVVGGGFRPEPQAVDAAGNDVVAQVDTGTYCWALTCACGRRRYAKRNSVHQVSLCRVCTTAQRKAKRRRSSSARTTTS